MRRKVRLRGGTRLRRGRRLCDRLSPVSRRHHTVPLTCQWTHLVVKGPPDRE